MATTLNFTDVTNTSTVTQGVSDGTGTFDTLMNTVNLYLNDQYTSGRLKGTDYANVLLGSIQAVLQQSINYELQEKLVAAQVDNALKDLEIKDAQKAEVLDSTLRANTKLNDDLLTTAKQRLALDEDIKLKIEQEKLTYTERVVKDKQAADLGLDNVYNKAASNKAADTEYVYTPFYEETV